MSAVINRFDSKNQAFIEEVEKHSLDEQPLLVTQPVQTGEKVGRKDPCPCGSGKKYKKCCL
ncbi:SEC-C metal-binding domain-containing protein [Bacillus sp. es.034]|uniref:SEC-C metal-binding domain-containing protein n=1 Tax=Bacillus sp. es.034 TaxID=1761763 RepID=UPI000BF2E4B3